MVWFFELAIVAGGYFGNIPQHRFRAKHLPQHQMKKAFLSSARNMILGAIALAAAHDASAQTLLSYWNFNNVSPGYLSGNGTLGSFSTTAAAYGETYIQTSGSAAGILSSNTANGTIFSGTSVNINFANLGTVATPIINGKTFVSNYTAQGQTNTTVGGYGTFSDTTLNRVAGDSTTGNSLIIMNPSGSSLGKYVTFSLSSTGYDTLSLSYATRISAGTTGTEIWSYSTDGVNYFSLGSISPTAGSFGVATLNLSTLSGNALDNQGTFYLRMTIGNGTSASYALDNIQLTGVAIPEPATTALVVGGLGLGLGFVRRNRSVRA